mmetsp:Transcript_15164/g.20019  ORF Transcript_15164/g.20019 Transcript_15164/m.20019 type:complete len:499 (+) Transcript_15164:63-1559(+)
MEDPDPEKQQVEEKGEEEKEQQKDEGGPTTGLKKKKKKKKNKKQSGSANVNDLPPAPSPGRALVDAAVSSQQVDPATANVRNVSPPVLGQEVLLQTIQRLQAQQRMAEKRNAKPKEHKFWNTQPVPHEEVDINEFGPIEVPVYDEIRREPYNMPAGFEWSNVDVMDDGQIDEVYNLLTENYVEDDDNMFRFDYSVPFLRWALTPPEYNPDLHIGVRNSKNGKLLGFITGIPVAMQIYDDVVNMVEINFLCVHKKLRSKRLAPVLIKEVTRRVNLARMYQAVYTAGVVLPKPVAECRYWHRSLDPKKLIEAGFSRLKPKTTMQRTIKEYRLPPEPQIPGFRPMVESDVPEVQQLIANYLTKTKIYPRMNEADIAHWVFTTEGVVNSYVVENPETKKITDVTSFYHLPSTIIGNPKHNKLNAAYSYYNVATSVEWTDLMRDSLIMARNVGMDVFNALDIMDNSSFLSDLKFGIGDGHLQYYLYNWKCPKVESKDIGLVLL